MRNLGTKSPDISGPPGKTSVKDLLKGALYKFSSQDLYERSLYKTSWNPWTTQTASQELSTKSLHKPHRDISIQDLLIPLDLLGPFTRAPYKIFTRPLWEISSQELSTRSLHKTTMSDISIQDRLISLELLGLFTGALYKISSRDLYQRSLWEISITEAPSKISSQYLYQPRPLWNVFRSLLQDLFTRFLWEISLQELSTRSLHKTSMRDL